MATGTSMTGGASCGCSTGRSGEGGPANVYESGLMQRVVVIEFDSLDQAVKAHDSAGYQAALAALANGADRDIRIVEGVA